MRVRAVAGALAALILTVGLSACSTDNDDSMSEKPMTQSQESEDMSTDSGGMEASDGMEADASDDMSDTMKKGAFEGLNGKTVSGTVTVNGDELELTGFKSDEGPDLHVYLTNGTDEAAVSAGMMIDQVSFDTAEQTFSLDGIDVADFTDVVINCDKAKAIFGAAKLS